MIDVILVGCTKIISKIICENPKDHAKRLSKEYIKSNVDTFVRLRYLSKQEKDNRQTFRPFDIRNKHPRGFNEIKKY
jgi:hypothetical protein